MLVESVKAASFDLFEANIATTCGRYGKTNPDFYYLGFVDNRILICELGYGPVVGLDAPGQVPIFQRR